ncbi:hypothetical protein B0H14DRAFT_2620004 [Mycena olivaceomarginata]|nr:hypothetical protein B0H14DRAFT_2620004 [Mycena olivaceomarginata]
MHPSMWDYFIGQPPASPCVHRIQMKRRPLGTPAKRARGRCRTAPDIRLPAGKTPASATIVATANGRFTLYANGVLLGSAPNTTDVWNMAQMYHNVDLSASSSMLFAIRAMNLPDVETGSVGPSALLWVSLSLSMSNHYTNGRPDSALAGSASFKPSGAVDPPRPAPGPRCGNYRCRVGYGTAAARAFARLGMKITLAELSQISKHAGF